ncbi:MAG: hypothetical protein K0S70_3108 [Microbacterium sp.]|jgi:hypothetical protein|nr:hypothetical protein [Microbacterium sp.]
MTTNTATRGTKRKMALAAGALVLAGVGGTLASGAWFTDQQKMTGNELTAATVVLDSLTSGGATKIEVSNLLPSADSTGGKEGSITISNSGTAKFLWAADLDPGTPTKAGFLDAVQIEFRQGGAGNWSAPTSIATAAAVSQKSASALDAGTSTTLDYRVSLPSTTANDLQGASVAFDVVVKAIQADAPDSTFDDDTQFPTS